MREKEDEGSARKDAIRSGVSRGGRYLTFLLGPESYGVDVLKVQEIIGVMPVTRVPQMPHYVRGVINLRGKILPVIDLRTRFGMEASEDTSRTCIVVAQVVMASQRVTMGIVVDEVSEVLDISDEKIECSPAFGTDVKTQFISGMGVLAEKVVMLLDINRVLAFGKMQELSALG